MDEPSSKYWLRVGRAGDLPSKRDRAIYRAFEIFPGFLVWLTFGLIIFFSWRAPVEVAIFAIIFDVYWFSRALYFNFHLKNAFNKLKIAQSADWAEKFKNLGSSRKLWQLVIIPAYKEDYIIIKETIQRVREAEWPKEKLIIVLGLEDAASAHADIITRLANAEFQNKGFVFRVTRHPQGLPGELRGKGSNETWAAKWIKENVIDKERIPYEDIIVSSFDADTVIGKDYFMCVAYNFLTTANPYRASFQPIPLFTNNVEHTPSFSRVMAFSSTYWHMISQERPEKHITFSSHSMSFKTLDEVGFWQTNVVSEDSRIFWQCYLFYNGDYEVKSIYYPVAMDANVAPTIWQTFKNIYKQQRRWAYGVADIPYWMFGYFKQWKNIRSPRKWRLPFFAFEGFYSWPTTALMLFSLGFLPVFLGGDAFRSTVLSFNLPEITSDILTVAMLGIATSAYLSIGLMPKPKLKKIHYVTFTLQWILFIPLSVFLVALPAVEAHTRLMLGKYMGFWPTPKYRN